MLVLDILPKLFRSLSLADTQLTFIYEMSDC